MKSSFSLSNAFPAVKRLTIIRLISLMNVKRVFGEREESSPIENDVIDLNSSSFDDPKRVT